MAYEGAHPLPLASGGTGASTLTGVLTGNGTSAVTAQAVTQYNVLIGGAANAVTSIAPGAAGQALLSAGALSNPAFGAVTGASLVWLSSQTATSSASINFTSLISASYTSYFVTFYNVFPETDAAVLNMNLSNDNGSSWIATSYLCGGNYHPYNSTTFTNANSTTTCPINGGGQSSTTSNAPICGQMYLYNMNVAIAPEFFGQCTYFISGGTLNEQYFSGTNTANTGINALQFLFSAGDISTGTFTLYGVKNS